MSQPFGMWRAVWKQGQRQWSGRTSHQTGFCKSGHLRLTNASGKKRVEGLPQEKGPEAAGPNKSGDTAEQAQTQNPTAESSHHQWDLNFEPQITHL